MNFRLRSMTEEGAGSETEPERRGLRRWWYRARLRLRPRNWRLRRRRVAEAEKELPPNLLIISDLHLGEDCKPEVHMTYLRRLVTLERKLVDFLEYYSEVRLGGRPWRLIINGDMVDFMHVHLVPEDWGEDPDVGPTEEERRFGLGTGPRAVDRKLRRILARHPSVFLRLARFVEAGNELVVIAGNHDVEFHWPQVQEQFKQRLAELVGEESRERVLNGITVHPWFYCEPGLIYVEHGHQYDATASWDALLDPRPNRSDGELELNLSSASIRYFVNLNPQMDPHGKSDWSMRQFLVWAISQGLAKSLRIAYYYGYLSWRLINLWRQYGHEGRVRRRALHLERLYKMAESFGLPAEVVLRLDELRRQPITATLWGVLRVTYVDRLLIMGGTMAIAVAAWTLLGPFWAAGTSAVAVVAALWLSRREGRKRNLDPAHWMPATAAKIQRQVDVPVVVFGHTHNAAQEPLEGGAWYFNTGTWIDGQDAGDGVPFTHLLVERTEAGVQAGMYRWQERRSVPLFDSAPAVIPWPPCAVEEEREDGSSATPQGAPPVMPPPRCA
jgi:UDP-2,3-diacylglucosamine pyrophosphatase LpxH